MRKYVVCTNWKICLKLPQPIEVPNELLLPLANVAVKTANTRA